MAEIPTEIWIALRAQLETLDLSTPVWPQWPIAYPGSTYEPAGGRTFLAVGEVLAAPVRRVINRNVKDYSGSFMVAAVMPIGQDPAVYREIGAKIASHFEGTIGCGTFLRLTMMSSTGVTPHSLAGYRDGGWWRVPVNIPWRTWQ